MAGLAHGSDKVQTAKVYFADLAKTLPVELNPETRSVLRTLKKEDDVWLCCYKSAQRVLETYVVEIKATKNSLWPEPTEDEPSMEQLREWGFDGIVEATDGCRVEPDGVCEHGYPSWFIHIGVI